MLAAKSGPTAVRGQYYGIAAAVGKVGAFVGTWAFPPMIDGLSRPSKYNRIRRLTLVSASFHQAFGGKDSTRGNTGPFWVGSGLAIFSALITFFFIRPLSADGMAKEDREFRAYLEAQGWDTSQMGDGSEEISAAYDEEGSIEKEKQAV